MPQVCEIYIAHARMIQSSCNGPHYNCNIFYALARKRTKILWNSYIKYFVKVIIRENTKIDNYEFSDDDKTKDDDEEKGYIPPLEEEDVEFNWLGQ